MFTREELEALCVGVDVENVTIKGKKLYVYECPKDDIKWVFESDSLSDEESEHRLLCVSLCDENGKPMLTRDDVALVAKFGPMKKRKLIAKAMLVNGLISTAEKETDEAEPGKN